MALEVRGQVVVGALRPLCLPCGRRLPRVLTQPPSACLHLRLLHNTTQTGSGSREPGVSSSTYEFGGTGFKPHK